MKYIIKFSKNGYIRYTSHLDMMRLFQRSFKRAGIVLAYSQGFHPHPKMSIAHPLSLGFVSDGEYIEITAQSALNIREAQKSLNAVMPEGLEIIMIKPAPEGIKSLAAHIEYGEYEAVFALNETADNGFDLKYLEKKSHDFMCQDQIMSKKIQKKTDREVVLDIKPFIYKDSFKIGLIEFNGNNCPDLSKVNRNYYSLNFIIKTGSTTNLNPLILLNEFISFAAVTPLEGSLIIRRKGLYFCEGNILKMPESV